MSKITPDDAFCRDVPVEMQEDVMEEICEAAHNGTGTHGRVYIIDVDKIDVINLRAHGVLTLNDNEFVFIVEDGNMNGTVLLGWEDAGQQNFKHHTPTQWVLVPNADVVSRAITAGRGAFLIMKWDLLAAREDAVEIPRKYAYDRHFQPGLKVENYWKAAAAKLGFVLSDKENADRVRARLLEATEPTP